MITRSTVYAEPGRFAGWPANYGMWSFPGAGDGTDDEVVLVFLLGHTGSSESIHARDMSRPFVPVVARSHDSGTTWALEDFTGRTPGSPVLSGDEHVDEPLRAGPRLTDADFATLAEPLDLADPETLVLLGRTGLGGGARSWSYASHDRGLTWAGPYALPGFGVPGVAARTDVVALGAHEALWILTAAKADGHEGHVFAAYTGDGGRTFERRGWLGPEPAGLQIMPSSVLLADGRVLSAVRCHGPRGSDQRCWIDLHASTDQGRTWDLLATPVPDTGPAGNPPALLDLGDRLVCLYGYRGPGAGLRAVVSADRGRTWEGPVVLSDDTATLDMGYPRAVVLSDASVLACFYSNTSSGGERTIEAVRWRP